MITKQQQSQFIKVIMEIFLVDANQHLEDHWGGNAPDKDAFLFLIKSHDEFINNQCPLIFELKPDCYGGAVCDSNGDGRRLEARTFRSVRVLIQVWLYGNSELLLLSNVNSTPLFHCFNIVRYRIQPPCFASPVCNE